MKKLTALVICAFIAISAAFAQKLTLDDILRIEKAVAQTPAILRQAWEAGRTQTDTVIDTPYGKVSIKFNLDEIIQSTYTGSTKDFYLRNWHGEMLSNGELRINNGGSWKTATPEGMKATVTHELGHYMMDNIKYTNIAPSGKYRTVEDVSEIDADAFAMRYMGKSDYTARLKRDSSSQNYIDLVIKRAEEIEREEKGNFANLRANAAQAFADSAIAAFGRKNYDKVIADYTQAIRIDTKFATAYSNRGSAYGMKGEYDKAIADYNKAMELNPGIMYLYGNRGVAYFEKGDYDRAMADYNQAIRLDPNNAEVKNILDMARQLKQLKK